jgi:hypothetical protein
MPLTLPDPPAGYERVVGDAIRRVDATTGLDRPQGPRRAGAPPAAPSATATPAAPHPVYTLDLHDLLAGGRRLEAAKAAGWHVLVLDDRDRPLAGVEFVADVDGKRALVRGVYRGPAVAALLAALSAAEATPLTAGGVFSLGLLRVPALYIITLWLRRGRTNLFLPVAPAPVPLIANRVFGKREFFTVAARLAKRRASFNDAPTGQPLPPPPGWTIA